MRVLFFQAAALWKEGEKPVKPAEPGILLVLRSFTTEGRADGTSAGLALNLGKGYRAAVARMGVRHAAGLC